MKVSNQTNKQTFSALETLLSNSTFWDYYILLEIFVAPLNIVYLRVDDFQIKEMPVNYECVLENIQKADKVLVDNKQK